MSSASPPRNFSSDLRLISAGAPHESTSPASNLARASARTLVLCLALVRMQYGGAIQTLRCAAPRSFSLRPATQTQAPSPRRQTRKRSRPAHPDTNPIVPRGGFLQVAVSEAPLHSVSTPCSSLGGASDTALRLLARFRGFACTGHPLPRRFSRACSDSTDWSEACDGCQPHLLSFAGQFKTTDMGAVSACSARVLIKNR